MNPLNWPGPQFLQFFFVASVISLIAALLVREAIRRTSGGLGASVDRLDRFELAMLAAGRVRTLQTAILSLVQSGAVKLVSGGMVRALEQPPAGASSFEKTVYDAIGKSGILSVSQLMRRSAAQLDAMEARLAQAGLLISRETQRLISSVTGLILFSVPLLGLAKIMVGLSRNRPVTYLVGGCIVVSFIGILLLNLKPRRTWLGDRALEKQKTAYAVSPVKKSDSTDNQVLVGMALFGPALLSMTAYADLSDRFAEIRDRSSWVSSCGGSSCGGGGGGCGGGGCGGCSG